MEELKFKTKTFDIVKPITVELPDGGILNLGAGKVMVGDDPVVYDNRISFPIKYDFEVSGEKNLRNVRRVYTYNELLALGMNPETLNNVATYFVKALEEIMVLLPEHVDNIVEE